MSAFSATDGEVLAVPERMVVAPGVGVFRPLLGVEAEGDIVSVGQAIGTVEGPGLCAPVTSPFRGRLMGMMAQAGERVRQGQPVAWLRVA
jgi:biotin carboxyl carrier protein